jgi:hypothetical protein
MKTPLKNTFILLIGMLFTMTAYTQTKNEIRVKIVKNEEGNTTVVDTIIQIPGDSLLAFWTHPDHPKMKQKTDSLLRIAQLKIQKLNMDSIMNEVESKMEHMDFHFNKMNDSLFQHKIKVIAPKLRSLDSMSKHHFDVQLQNIDSLHKKVWIMRSDSLPHMDFDLDFKFDFEMDSMMKSTQKHLVHLNSKDITAHLPSMEELNESIREGMKHARFFIIDGDIDWKSEDNIDLQYHEGKVVKVKTDGNGQMKKAIIMSPDGEEVDVIEGKEAYRFVTGEGEQIIIISQVKLQDLSDREAKDLKKKGVITSMNKNDLPAQNLKVFPNPNDGTFRLTFQLPKNDEVLIRIFDQSGNTVYSEKLQEFKGKYDKEISLNSKIRKGIYFLNLTQSGHTITKKLLVE